MQKPSVFEDRGSIGSEDELDEYGVWIKPGAESASVAMNDNSTELLTKIADILEDIKHELVSIKDTDGQNETEAEVSPQEVTLPDLSTLIDFTSNPDDLLSDTLTEEAVLPERDDELETLENEGVRPISPPPEDTSYLDEDPLAHFDSEMDSINSSDVSNSSDTSNSVDTINLDDINLDDISFDMDFDKDTEPEDKEDTPEKETEDSIDTNTDDSFDIPMLDDISLDENDTVIPESWTPDVSTNIPEPEVEAEADAPLPAFSSTAEIPADLKEDITNVLTYMDELLEYLPEDKIDEFKTSPHFAVYKKVFDELGLS
ncbi:MAG: hypothetical protein LBM77_11870 [Spirochaetaceae bacterium]|jgi:hypothetical protein|nr:hypothetical protein [Spirochaetaceae bacterium]